MDIDNTLEAVTMFSGDTVYQAVNGENVQAFATDLSDGIIMTMATDDHMISMSIWTYDSTEEAVIEEEFENSVVAEDDTMETEPATTQESVPEEPTDSAEATKVSNSDNDLVSDLAFVEEEDSEMSILSVDETEIIREDATIEEQQDDTIVAQILTEDVGEDPVADTEEAEHWELDDVMPDALRSSILYEDVFPGVDLRYDTFSYNVKESIILKQPMDLDEYVYSFLLTLDGLEPELQEDGSILLLDEAYEVQYTIPAPYMWDSEDVYSDAVFYELEETDDGWVLTVCADEDWLEDGERVYPVTIDPSVEIKNDKMLFTTAVEKGTPTSSSGFGTPGYTSIGLHDKYGQFEGYIKITELPNLPVGSIVTEARLSPGIFGNNKITVDFRVDISKLEEEVSAAEWSGHVAWSSRPRKESKPMDFTMVSHKETNYMAPGSWDITPAVMSWYNGTSPNYGLSLTSTLMSSSAYSCSRLKAANVELIVTYRNAVGTESYYTYETQSAVRAGTGYVGDFSSALTVFKTDISYSSATIPFSVSHVYNSSLAGKEISAYRENEGVLAPDYSQMKTGNGWQLSVQESVVQKYINKDNRQVYRDGDGTLHYFNWVQQSTYVDEDGLGLTLRQYADGEDKDRSYEIKDQQGNIRFFRNNVISYIADANGNRIYFLYNDAEYSASSTAWHPKANTNSRLTKIIAVNKEQTESLICKFTYVNDRLSSITDYAGRVTKYTYDSAGNLTKVTHPDNTEARYTYDAATGHLTGMYDAEAKYGIEYTYDGNGVASIQEYAINGANAKVVGTELEREKPSIQETVYRYNGNDRIFYTDDDIVNCYAFDYAGRTINAVTLNHDDTKILGVTAAAYTDIEDASDNKIEKTGQSGQNGVNLLSAGGLETHDGYVPSDSDWEKTFTADHCAATIKDNEVARTGVGSLKTWMNYNAANNATREEENDTKRVAIHQTVQLEGGKTYTVSAYVNTQGIQSFDRYGGSYVAIMNSNNEVLSVGNKVSHVTSSQIENGWLRVYATFECKVDGEYLIAAVQDNGYGHSYFDDLQLEEGNVPSSVNLLQNGSFSEGKSEWSAGSFTTAAGELHHNDVLTVAGEPDKNYRLSQVIPIGGSCVDQTFLLSGWGKAASAADCKRDLGWYYSSHIENKNDERYYGLIAQLHYRDANNKPHSQYFYAPFNDDYDEWQFASCVIVPDIDKQRVNMTLESIEVYAVYDNNFNTMLVDNISLRKEPCTTYTYNTNGNVEGINATSSSVQSVKYLDDGVRPTTVHKSDDEAYIYNYDASNKYLPTRITNYETGVYTSYTYDSFGNITMTENAKCQVSNGQRISDYFIRSYAEYSDDGSQLESETNGNGQITSYLYNNYRDLIQTTDANGTNVVTFENVLNDRPKSSYISGKIFVGYSYDRGLLSRINRGGYIPGDSADHDLYYNMTYDDFGNMTRVSIGGNDSAPADTIVLADYNYGSYNNHLASMTYGNGDSIEYTYDDLDRMTRETWDDGTSYLYMYNAEGALAQKLDATDESKVDNGTADAVNYEYDSLGRLIHSSASENGETIVRTEHMYDRQNRIDTQTYQLRNSDGTFTTYVSDYSYRAADGALTKVDGVDDCFGDYIFEYDNIARLSARYNNYFRQDYTYRNISSSQTTTQIANIAYSQRPGGTSFTPFSLAYTYDALGNIKTITGTGISGQNASYGYDDQSQLTSAVVDGKNYSYEYDTYGNIRKAIENGTTHTYTYGDADWKDLLTAYDGQSITYDEIGNPTSYYNGTRWDFDWAKGRQLVSAESDDHEIEYTYDMAGIRDSKTVDGVTYNYLTLDGKVVRQTWGSNVLDIIYDNSGLPYAFKYNNAYYIYVLNQQGDVIRIVNSTGATVAEYRYDAWGNVIYSSGSMAAVNPIRYRGYYYDIETGFYYLQSRYYDPGTGRFINADSFASTGQGFIGSNMFAYCSNNPVNNVDPLGLWTISISGTFSGVFGLGISLSFGFAFDDQGNFDWQYSYAIPGVDDTAMVGGIGAGAGIAVQYTKADTVYDLYGPATYIGASVGPGWYIGGDIVSFSDASDQEMTTDGFQIVAGVGVGVDVHVTESYTRSVVKTKRSAQSSFSGGARNRATYTAMLY